MKIKLNHLIKTVLLLPIVFLSHTANAFIVVDGIAQQGDFDNPVIVDFELGSNNLSFFTDTFRFGPDVFRVTIEENQELDTAQLLNFTTFEGAGPAFFGILDATTFDPASLGAFNVPEDPDTLLTGMLFNSDDVGTDLFDADKTSNNANARFELPITRLTAGEYLFWFNETGGQDVYSIDFQLSGEPDAVDVGAVPLPAAAYLLLVPLAGVLGFKRKASV